MNWRAVIGFEICWLALAYWQQTVLIPVLMYWLYGMSQLNNKSRLAVLNVIGAGLLIDSALVTAGVIGFSDNIWLPLWFILLWAVFALAAVEVMAAMLTKPWLAALLGGIGGPVSYIAGAGLSGGILQFYYGQWSYLILSIVWALIAIALGCSRRWYA
ncbi:DUF2878 domain-containing protein [Rheinheimera salexigens]|uniref:DUF2878 domain-containing protein n=1 Tax=Rheinheimera salexigens TaxID=1628148 RepID=A0A1E7Q5B5_9GAMM|nr:DUF2878 domain-containing protein [Rheinheimera salexigens]OEY69359.1 hypothetical protein BI198_07070 [Rheinheimera salexigens]